MNKKHKVLIGILVFLILIIFSFIAVKLLKFTKVINVTGKSYSLKADEENYISVKFISNGGVWLDENSFGNGEIYVSEGDFIPAPEDGIDIYHKGCSLEGWYTDIDLTVKWDFNTYTAGSGDLILYANWNRNNYTVTFCEQYDNSTEDVTVLWTTEVPYGYTLITEGEGSSENLTFTYDGPSLEKSNKEFVSWISSSASYTVTEDTYFFARYVSSMIYVVNINYQYENGNIAAKSFATTKSLGESYSVTTPVINGYDSDIQQISETITDTRLEELENDNSVTVVTDTENKVCYLIYTVTYTPQRTSFVKNFYKQKVSNDNEYDLAETETVDNILVGTEVEAEEKNYYGFSLNSENSTTVAYVEPYGATVLNVYYDRDIYYIYIVDSGDTYLDAIPVRYGHNIPTMSTPTKSGYTFTDWTWKEDLHSATSISQPSTMPASDLYVEAGWNPTNTTYTISYYLENADDSEYTNIGTSIQNGTAESVLSSNYNLTTTIQNGFQTLKPSDYSAFTYNETLSKQNNNNYDVVVKGDGSTVINVYYNRVVYTIEFDLNDNPNYYYNNGRTSSRTFSTKAEMTVDGEVYTTASGNVYTITAKYEQNVNAVWPTYEEFTVNPRTSGGGSSTYYFQGWKLNLSNNSVYTSKRSDVNYDMVSSASNGVITLYGAYTTTSTNTELYYMVESFDQTDTSTSTTRKYYQGKYYDSIDELHQIVISNSTSWSAKDVKNLTTVGNEYTSNTTLSNGNRGYRWYFYYSRNSLELQFYNVNQVADTVSLPYETNIESYSTYEPDGYPIDTAGNKEWTFLRMV